MIQGLVGGRVCWQTACSGEIAEAHEGQGGLTGMSGNKAHLLEPNAQQNLILTIIL
ncbi:hypothetical protein AA18889_2276 [Acetobacter senegalensis DSM 18889]|uniref:Uncharacterized protein n=1 Tax=Acetobacter pasteurianus subsp. pasteurianus TaxID=481145 RepID=A0A1Y0Y205_ACEPA|nr:hypothetical protein S1001342_02142 [Acetobacter pasteurianus subsp. pasteurianus]GBR59780.1 hypothetical protein AA18889_2276 [Acetobacter senegalensis DSM 18889]